MASNVEQARMIYDERKKKGWKIPPHRCDEKCVGTMCVSPLLLGQINPPTFSDKDVIWGPEATGDLLADFNHRSGQIIRLYARFPMPPWGQGLTEDYTVPVLGELSGSRQPNSHVQEGA